MRVTTRIREGNIGTPMRIKPERNRKRVATAMTSNVPSGVHARLAGSAEFGAEFVLRRATAATRATCYTVSAF
jgi:hypothetical protein